MINWKIIYRTKFIHIFLVSLFIFILGSFNNIVFAGTATHFIFTSNPTANMLIAGSYGATNTLAYSYDGINWIGLGNSIFPIAVRGLVWNGIMWVAGGQSGINTLAYSYNGIDWTGLGTSVFTGSGRRADWNGNMWIVAGGAPSNTLAYSYNGIDWTGLGTSVFSDYGYTVKWNGSIWVAVGGPPNTIAYSYDGLHWIGLGSSIFSGFGDSVVWNGSMWIASGSGSGTSNVLAYSYDGISWTPLGLANDVFSPGSSGRRVAWNGTIWVACIYDSNNTLAYSYDGINWIGLGKNIFSLQASGVIWNGSKWIAVGYGTNSIAYSYNGIDWMGLGTSIFSSVNGVEISSNQIAPRGDIKSGTAFAKQPVITAEDDSGNVDTTYTGTVTLSLASGSGILNGTLTKAFVNGVADFSGNGVTYTATYDHEPFTIKATDGNFSITSSSLIADVVATKLVFTTQPGNTSTGASLTTQPIVTAEDNNNLIDTDFTENVTISLNTGSGSLQNNIIRAVSGVATFTNLIYNSSSNNERFSLSANDEDTWGIGDPLTWNIPTIVSNSNIGNISISNPFPFSIYQPQTSLIPPVVTPQVTSSITSNPQTTITNINKPIITSLINTLKPNTHNKQVRTLQSLLKKQGYFTYKYITDYYGIYTKQAVTKYLKNNK